MNTCDFCNEFSGGRANAFASRYPEIHDRIVFSTEHFNVIPTLGQLTEGHLLVVPKAHFTALADMPDRLLQEFDDLVIQSRTILKMQYNRSVAFEHGVRTDAGGGCGICHAHLHIVPLKESTDPINRLKAIHKWVAVESMLEIKTKGSLAKPYLYYEDAQLARYMFEVEYLPSQYIRRVLADELGKRDWDWREAGREPGFLLSCEGLSSGFHRVLVGSRE